MKRLLFFFALLFAPMAMYATPQEDDIIYMDGVLWHMERRPISADSVLLHDLKAALPENHVIRSSNWAGYTAYWSIQNDYLYLDSIMYLIDDKATKKTREVCMPSDILHRVFKNHYNGTNIVATWLHEDLRVGSGKIIYQHLDGSESYENEQFISVDHGKVTGTRTFHNYIGNEGFSFDNYYPQNNAELSEKFRAHIKRHLDFERYIELANVKQILFNIAQARVDSTGHLVECVVRAVFQNGKKYEEHPGIAAEMVKALKAYYPWRVSFINGEYRALGIAGWTIPIFISLPIEGQIRHGGRDLALHEISFKKKFVRTFMNDSIQDMVKEFGMNNEQDVLCVYFRKDPDRILFWPRNLKYGITEWFLNSHINHILGYYKKDDVRVLVLCEDANKFANYFKIKKKTITLHIENHAPSNEAELVYKEYMIYKNKSMSLIDENIPQREVWFW